MEQLRCTVSRNEEEKQRLEAELVQVKEMLQREVSRADSESRRNGVIIAEYKQVNNLKNHLPFNINYCNKKCNFLYENKLLFTFFNSFLDLPAFRG